MSHLLTARGAGGQQQPDRQAERAEEVADPAGRSEREQQCQSSQAELEDTEPDDRCGPAVRAMYRANRNGELYLCRHCASQLRQALSAQGWVIWPVGEQGLGPHACQQSLLN